MKVFVLWECSEDRHFLHQIVFGVFLTKERAEEAKRKLKFPYDAEISEVPLDTLCDPAKGW